MSGLSDLLIHHDLDGYVAHRFGMDPATISRDLATGWSEPLPSA